MSQNRTTPITYVGSAGSLHILRGRLKDLRKGVEAAESLGLTEAPVMRAAYDALMASDFEVMIKCLICEQFFGVITPVAGDSLPSTGICPADNLRITAEVQAQP